MDIRNVIFVVVILTLILININVTRRINKQVDVPLKIRKIGIYLIWLIPFIGAHLASRRILPNYKGFNSQVSHVGSSDSSSGGGDCSGGGGDGS